MAKILIPSKISDEGLAHLKQGGGLSVEYGPELRGPSLFKVLGDVEALIIRTEPSVTRELLSHAPKLKIICRAGIGVDHIDLAACQERGIVVMNTPAANRTSTAEHALAMLLAVSRSIPQATHALKSGRWDRDHFTGHEISKKTLGIIGLGNIGQRVALRAKVFEMNVIACDPYLNSSVAAGMGIPLLPLESVLNSSDYVTLHVPLTNETRKMAGEKFFAQMKEESFFINTSRGKVVDEKALAQALEKKHLRGAALDVFDNEPILKDNPLLKLDNVILTPHVAGQTWESQRAMSLDAARQVRAFFEEGKIAHAVKSLS